MKKYLVALLVVAVAALTLVGCGDNKKKRDPNTISIGIVESASVEDYNTNDFTKWLSEKTGLKIEFEKLASAANDYKAQIATRVANQEELPDMLIGTALGDDLFKQYGESGVLMDLKDIFYGDKEGYGKTFWEGLSTLSAVDQGEVIRKLTDVDTGAMYAFARIEVGLIDPMDYQVYINQKWLDKLGLKAPTNLDELYNVLVAFRDGDPNGNGEKDEIPLAGRTSSNYGDSVNWLINFFVYLDNDRRFNADENQKLYLPHMTNEYREALKFVAKLDKEGLITPLVWTMKNAEHKNMVNAKDGVETVGIFSEHSSIIWEDQNPVLYDYAALNLYGGAVLNAQSFTKRGCVTTYCQYPENALKVLSAMYSDEGWKSMYYGKKGVDWDDADPGEVSYLGYPADLKDITHSWGQQDNKTWHNVITFAFWSELEYAQFDKSNQWLADRYAVVKDCYNYYMDAAAKNNPKYIVGSLIYNTAEKERTQDIRTNVSSYLTEFKSKCCTNEIDINDDAVWNEYLKKLDELGVQTWIDQAQKLYDEQQKK